MENFLLLYLLIIGMFAIYWVISGENKRKKMMKGEHKEDNKISGQSTENKRS